MPPRPSLSVTAAAAAATATAAVLAALAMLAAAACSTAEPNLPYVLGGGNGGQASGVQGPKTDDASARRDAADGDASDSGAVCTFVNSSRTNDLSGCTLEEDYTCRKAPLAIVCDCKNTFTCTCGKLTILADCSSSCAATTESIRTQCGVDTAPPLRDAGPNDGGGSKDF